MLLRSFDIFSRRLFQLFPKSRSYSINVFFCTWKPKIPNNFIETDKTFNHMTHPIWILNQVEQIEENHYQPRDFKDKFAFISVKTLLALTDLILGYKPGKITEEVYLKRFIFLEVMAGVPGMIGATIRHIRFFQSFKSDGEWINHLLEDAENERMHLFTFLDLKKPSYLFRATTLFFQSAFITFFTILYIVSHKTAHRFVGYFEEEATKMYTLCIKDIDNQKLPMWTNLSAPLTAREYWNLNDGTKIRDVLLAIRADEVMHREINHHLANLEADQSIYDK